MQVMLPKSQNTLYTVAYFTHDHLKEEKATVHGDGHKKARAAGGRGF